MQDIKKQAASLQHPDKDTVVVISYNLVQKMDVLAQRCVKPPPAISSA